MTSLPVALVPVQAPPLEVLSPPPDALWGSAGEVAQELAATGAALMQQLGGSKRWGACDDGDAGQPFATVTVV